MSSFKEKAQVFIIGLAIGLLIAGAFFILKLDDYFKELSLYKKVTQTFSPSQPSPLTETKDNTESEKKKSSSKSQKNKTVTLADSLEAASHTDLPMDADTLRAQNDSINAVASEDDIVVRKDELLNTKTLEVFNLNPVAAKPTSKDSLLQRVSGIRDDKAAGKQMFNVELWQSPLNYKGYKLSKYKMVLYGFSSVEGIKIYKLDDVIYLKNASTVYRLDYASDFKQYERITDEQIINKLK